MQIYVTLNESSSSKEVTVPATKETLFETLNTLLISENDKLLPEIEEWTRNKISEIINLYIENDLSTYNTAITFFDADNNKIVKECTISDIPK